MAKTNPGYQIDEGIADAVRQYSTGGWVKPIEDVVAAAILHYLEANEDHRLTIRARLLAWRDEVSEADNDAEARASPGEAAGI